MRADEILPDAVNQVDLNGMVVRKGSVAAFMANARILQNPHSRAEARAEAEQDLLALLPAVRALGLFEIFALRDAELQRFVDAH